MHKISKSFEFDFGHRVWNQKLKPELAGTSLNKCRFLHGHRGKVVIELKSETLKDGMVMDFNELNFFKEFLDRYIDHKFLVDENDPSIGLQNVNLMLNESEDGFKTEASEDEIDASFVYVPFCPTAENISKWFYEILVNKLGTIVNSVTFYETPKAKATYTKSL